MGEFNSVIEDVRASKGILICNAGFTVTAKQYAQKRKIDICTAHDASNKKWETEIKIPVIKTSVTVEIIVQHYSLPNQHTKAEELKMPFPEMAVREFLKRWESNELNKTPGTHYLELDKDLIKLPGALMSLRTRN